MPEFPKRFAPVDRLYGWINPRHDPDCRYLNLLAEEVAVSLVTRDSDIKDATMDFVGEVVFCTIDVYGKPRFVPPEVQRWVDETRLANKHINYAQKNKEVVPIEDTIASFKKSVAAKSFCHLKYYGSGDCTCGQCRISRIDARTNSYGYRSGEIK